MFFLYARQLTSKQVLFKIIFKGAGERGRHRRQLLPFPPEEAIKHRREENGGLFKLQQLEYAEYVV